MPTKMTEKQWASSTYVWAMLRHFVGRKTCERRFRLFACACARRYQAWFSDECLSRALETAELFAEGGCSPRALEAAFMAAYETRNRKDVGDNQNQLNQVLVSMVCSLCSPPHPRTQQGYGGFEAAEGAASCAANAAWQGRTEAEWFATEDEEAEKAIQGQLVREIFGNPFRKVKLNKQWRSSTVMQLARGIYDNRNFGDLPILADAFQDAGCDCDDILNHFRDPNATHVRGCWALDLVLGKQ